ncbi:hypothetical protein DPMN_085583 [Dreissena polymorpha]|uniref:Uncharacterized protein n=1 Tax=Dreissena polymorpha TaxID=45954 RepID=A0A9D3YE04_DREPO|nr:hypothetical protein DPMN_085583 [Dreissena polymorpha]
MSKCPSLLHYPVKPEIGILTVRYHKGSARLGSARLAWLAWLESALKDDTIRFAATVSSCLLAKRIPRNCDLTSGKTRKTIGAKSGLRKQRPVRDLHLDRLCRSLASTIAWNEVRSSGPRVRPVYFYFINLFNKNDHATLASLFSSESISAVGAGTTADNLERHRKITDGFSREA